MSGAQTGVGFVISSSHADKITGQLHGHSYEVVAWFEAGHDAEKLRERVRALCADLDHAVLPPELAWGEALALEVKARTNAVEVEVMRPLERIYARTR